MKSIVFDLETDGLLPDLTRIHSLVLRDVETGEVVSCTDDPRGAAFGYSSISHGLALLSAADSVYGHNIIRFDLPALKKIHPTFSLNPNCVVRDTFVVAAMRWAHIKDADFNAARDGKYPARLAGSHSLEAWGYRLGVHKGEYTTWCKEQGVEPWAMWRPEMQTYCEEDTATNLALVLKIREAGVSPEAVEIEHALAAYLAKQEDNGWPFDMDAAVSLQASLSARREELGQRLVERFGSWKVPDGKPFVPKRDSAKLGYTAGVPVQKFKTVTFNPNSRDHIADRLQTVFGWQPTTFTPGGKPEITDDTLDALSEIPAAQELTEFLLIQKRLGQLAEGKEAWLLHAKKNGLTGMHHIHGRVKQNFAITHRAAHSNPNLGQVPAVGKPFGAECRALFTVPKGWVQIGADASGLELRCLANYMARFDGGAYGEVILHGDIHSTNRDALGLEGKSGRDIAKRFIYAFLYGAGDPLLGQLIYDALVAAGLRPKANVKDSKAFYAKVGKSYRQKFLKGLPALGALLDAVKLKASTNGYLILPDKRRVYIRHAHAALNSLLQGAGAIICKAWIVEFDRRLTERFGPQGWDGQWAALGWIHDEVQLAVRPEIADEVKQILVESIRHITTVFNWRLALDGEAKQGANWRDTH